MRLQGNHVLQEEKQFIGVGDFDRMRTDHDGVRTTQHAVAVSLEIPWDTPHSTPEGYLAVGRQLAQAVARYLEQAGRLTRNQLLVWLFNLQKLDLRLKRSPAERARPELLKASRKRRIAAGSGVPVQEVNRLLSQFEQMRSMMKQMKKGGLAKMMRAMGGLASLRSPQEALMVFVTSVVIWLLETGKYWFVMHAFPFEVSFFALMLMNGIVNIATTLPSAPGYIGTFDAPGIAVLAAYNIDQATAAGYTLTLHVALWLPITVLGAYYLAREGIKWSDSLRAETSDA